MKVLITDYGFKGIDTEKALIESAGHELVTAQCKTEEEVIAAGADCDALLVQWAPVKAQAAAALKKCRVIVRYGIGVDNLDLPALKAAGIAACNVPDYCIDEVADHTVSLALALARQLPQTHARTLGGQWKITPPSAVPAFRQMTFATAGFGRIARAALERVKGFGFTLAAYDPYVDSESFARSGVKKLELEELFSMADILSLHLPLTNDTRHLVNETRLGRMKKHAVVVNTARGPLIDTNALATALKAGVIGGAGLDVFEKEPLETDHPLRECPNVLMTSHTAWYSEASVPELQKKAAEEILRGLNGEPLKNRVN
ncbi:C-terminal binding protein [Kamptonema cortianum]|nr:C-terminal binding protein [Oscillatoria laete-virens]MDK3159934.1 C-terminal binding protein [Kamptonema cortianum]MDL5047156.1 C-terminal binding protein [Oscillatoria amoena NRMC-F 0135]MDL5055510.1 C-terminal binding protein [Oscillatoria laete-virens NRMC-F 0139]